ncbi:MAG: heme-binding protein [Pseudomonadota bacterium]|nr:heme-binding protein [Pseudomonadota bacterium]
MPGIEVLVRQLSTEEAINLVNEAVLEARARGLAVAAAIVDEVGDLLAYQRDRRAMPAAGSLARRKAHTAAAFRRDTQAMQQSVEQGRTSYLAMSSALPLAGGVRLRVNMTVLGALGIAGASSTEDAHIASTVIRRAGFELEEAEQ